MILADTSVWVELLRRSGSPANLTFRRLLDEGARLVTTELVVGEVLAGARDDLQHVRLRRELSSVGFLSLRGRDGFERAARISRRCRAEGFAVQLTDCLVAAPALEAGASILHADSHFDQIAQVTGLKVHPLDES